MGKYTVVTSDNDLVEILLGQARKGELPWARLADLRLEAEGRGDSFTLLRGFHRTAFRLAPRLNPTRRQVEALADHGPRELPAILLTVRLTAELARSCRELGVSCLDLNGHAYIKSDGLLIDRSPPPSAPHEQYVTEVRAPDIFSPKSSRLARVLLSFRDRAWKQADLVSLTGINAGLVSRILNHLVDVGWARGTRGDWRLTDFDALLDAWRTRDNWARRARVREYATLERYNLTVARQLLSLPGRKVAFTQWFAAALRFPYADVPIVSAYVDAFPSEDALKGLGLAEVSTGGRVWAIVPRDEGVFQAGRDVDGLPLASDVQVYLDLLQVGLRGPDQAKALREWTGFCR
jgi:hypothetical protein